MLGAGKTGDGWEGEMVSLEAQLNASVRMQIESTREGIQRLGASQDRLSAIRDAMTRATGLCKQSDTLIANYPTIRQVSKTCENFRLIRSVYDRFSHLDETVARTDALLQQDKEGGTSENLLLIYQYLHKLELFRTQTLELMKDAPQAVTYTIRRYFKKLDDLSADFDSFYWQLPKDFYGLAVRGEQQVLARWALVLSRMDRSGRTRMTSILDDWVTNKFGAASQTFAKVPSSDVEGTLQAISFWLGDLSALRDGLVTCFPPDMAMMDWYALTFHKNIHGVIGQCLQVPQGQTLEAGDILFLLRWVKNYHDKMTSELGIAQDDLEPPLLSDAQESALIAAYLEVGRSKIGDWIGNVYEGERQAFTERPQEPDVDASNYYLSPASVDLIQIVKQHITTTSESGQGRLVLEVISDTVKTVVAFQDRINKLVRTETDKYLAKPDQVAPHLEPYILMMGNTGLRWATSLQSEIVDGLEAMVATEYLAAATKQLKSLSDGFIGIGKEASAALCRIIFSAVQPAIAQLFTAPWYDEASALLPTIMFTFGDFFTDYREHSEDFLFAKLVADVLETFLLAYFQQLRAKTTKLKPVEALLRFEADTRTVLDFFSEHRDARRVQKAVDALQKFTSLVSSSQKMVYLEFFAFWKVYPDLPLQLFEEVLARRDDLDRSSIKDIMETCRKKTQEERITDVQPSIFSKLKL